MELVTHDSATMLEQDQAQRLLLEMAAVVRTIFGAQRPAGASSPAAPHVVVATTDTEAFPGTAVSAVAATPTIPVPSLAVPSLPVPSLAVPPLPVPDHGDPEERHSLALLQEIAFLDE